MTSRRDRTREAGFLLAEMLVTLTISAFVLTGLVGLGALMVRTADRSMAEIDTSDDLGRTLMNLDHLLGTARRARLDGTTARLFLFNGDEHRLILAHGVDRRGVGSVTEAVMLSAEPDGRLYRAEAALPQKVAAITDLHFGPPRLLYAGSVRLRFAYVDEAPPGKAAGPAATLWPVGDRMPVALRIEAVDVVTGRSVAAVGSTIAADADLGCLGA